MLTQVALEAASRWYVPRGRHARHRERQPSILLWQLHQRPGFRAGPSWSSFGPPRRRNSKAPKAQSIDECAYILGIPAATVKTGMFYARKKLAELVAWGRTT